MRIGIAAERVVTADDQTRSPERPLLPRVALGDEIAAREVIQRYSPLVASISRRFILGVANQTTGGAEEEVEDAIQDIFLEIWRCASRFDEAAASEAAFVVMISRRRLIDRARSRRAARTNLKTVSLDGERNVDGSGNGGGKSFNSDVWLVDEASLNAEQYTDGRTAASVLRTLEQPQRDALVLSTVLGMAHQEIATELNLPLGTVKSHIRRGLSAVRAALFGSESESQSSDGVKRSS